MSNTDGSSFCVFRARIAIHGLEMEDRTILAVPVDDPPTIYCVAHKLGERIEIVGRFTTQQEAERACGSLAEQFRRIAESDDLANIDLARVVREAGRTKH